MGKERLERYNIVGPENQAAVDAAWPMRPGSAARYRASG